MIKKLKKEFDGCMVIKNDPNYMQGIPDLLVLHRSHWAALEVKASEDASHQPNQDYYVDQMDGMSFAAYLSPENEDSIFQQLNQHFRKR